MASVEVRVQMTPEEALLLSDVMSLAANNKISECMIEALKIYHHLLRSARKDDGLIQIWYPMSGRIEDIPV